jgi:drug/metabolite transporter (DMT)-like permease
VSGSRPPWLTPPPGRSYINPVIALALGATFAGEAVSPRELLATLFILSAVALVMVSMRTQNK